MGGEIGNNFAVKLKDKHTKYKVYKNYCDYLAKGKIAKYWYYEDETLTLTRETIEKYIKEDDDFDPIKKEIAIAKGFQIWETICEDGAKADREVNTPTLQMVMRNKYGWDSKTEDTSISKNEGIIEKIAANLAQDVKNQCPNSV